MAKLELNDEGIEAFLAQAQETMQQQVNEALQSTVREVRDEMSGQPADAVYEVLVERITRRIEGFVADEDALREIAGEIEAGTLED